MAVVIAAVILHASLVFAQSESAEELLREGVEQRHNSDDAAALRSFERAYAINPSGNTLGQMGLAEQALGQWAPAQQHLRAALGTTDPWVERNRAALESAYEIVLQHAPRAISPVTPHSRSSSSLRIAGAIGLGVGGAALVAGIVAWVVRESTVVSYNGRCRGIGDPAPPPGCDEAIAMSTASTAGTMALVGGIGGVVLAGAAGLLLGVTHSENASHAALSCGGGPGEIGASCTVRF